MSSAPIISGQQRPPLQPRDTSVDENISSDGTESSLATNSHSKRLNHDVCMHESENEPLNSIPTKRQRTKSGEFVNCSEETNCDHYLVKSDSLCERTMKMKTEVKDLSLDVNNKLNSDNQDEVSSNGEQTSLVLEKDCDAVENVNSECDNSHFYKKVVDNIESINGNNVSDNVETFNQNANGDISPQSAATIEYVAQLPEGCLNTVSSTNIVNDTPATDTDDDDDDELEEDDNYLDSSEAEDNDIDSCLLPGDDDESCGEDDQSVISSVTVGSTCSLRSIASETMGSIYMNENGVASNEDGSLLYSNMSSSSPLQPLIPSLFSFVPPTIKFCKYDETTAKLSEEISKFLKWRFTTITPLIVRKTILNSGFKIIKKSVLWCGTWGKHMKSPCFKAIKDFQKVNHFPGTFQIGRKDKLWKNFAKLQAKFGKDEFGFIPKTFVLPGDRAALKSAFDKEGVKKKWIVKPPASARGSGIQVINKWSQIPVEVASVVQRYISRPYLINDTKFDIRLYVLVTSFHPLRVFLYEDGLVRFASVQYASTSRSLSDRFMHLTNYSVNKSSSSYTRNDDAGHCHGHKWTLKTLWGYLKARNVDTALLWSQIADIVIKTVISGENDIVLRTKKFTRNMYNSFELFGFDVILDEKLRPWLLEVNISPSLHSASSLDHSVKGPLIADLMTLVGYHIPDRVTPEAQQDLIKRMNFTRLNNVCLDRRLYTRMMTAEEQVKHTTMVNKPRSQYLTDVLETLYPDDVRQLILHEDQKRRAGKFVCIFPTKDTHNYFGFLNKTRYYNILIDAWENAYADCREKGIDLLEKLCAEKYHLRVPLRFKSPKMVCPGPSSSSQISMGPASSSSDRVPSPSLPPPSSPAHDSCNASLPSPSSPSTSSCCRGFANRRRRGRLALPVGLRSSTVTQMSTAAASRIRRTRTCLKSDGSYEEEEFDEGFEPIEEVDESTNNKVEKVESMLKDEAPIATADVAETKSSGN